MNVADIPFRSGLVFKLNPPEINDTDFLRFEHRLTNKDDIDGKTGLLAEEQTNYEPHRCNSHLEDIVQL
jgi:hypothetical protein